MPHWPAFNPTDLPTMMFGDEVRVADDPNRARAARARGASQRGKLNGGDSGNLEFRRHGQPILYELQEET